MGLLILFSNRGDDILKINDILYNTIRSHASKIKDVVLKHDDVVNNCSSTSQNLPLSASQGNMLQNQINMFKDGIHYRKFYLPKGEHSFTVDDGTIACLFGGAANAPVTRITEIAQADKAYSYMFPFKTYVDDYNRTFGYEIQLAHLFSTRPSSSYIFFQFNYPHINVEVSYDDGTNMLFIILCGDVTLDE